MARNPSAGRACATVIMSFGTHFVVLDVGSWFRQQRITQANVDAAALAGAQALPGNPAGATSFATTFANKNAGVAGANITISTKWDSNDMITVAQARPAEGFFAKVLGISTVNVHAKASAISEVPNEALGVAPIVVNIKHPQLSGPGCPCFGVPTTLPLGKTGAPGAFALLNLIVDTPAPSARAPSPSGSARGTTRTFRSATTSPTPALRSTTRSSRTLCRAATAPICSSPSTTCCRVRRERRVPHRRVGRLPPAASQASGTDGSLTGYFTSVIWQGIISKSGPSANVPDLGVHSVALID